jgi:hypothetical protein
MPELALSHKIELHQFMLADVCLGLTQVLQFLMCEFGTTLMALEIF